METLPVFNLAMPVSCEGVPDEVMIPSKAWSDSAKYNAMLEKLGGMFSANFREKYSDVPDSIKNAGPF